MFKKSAVIFMLNFGLVFVFVGCSDTISSSINGNVDLVKNGALSEYSNSLSVGNAIDSWSKIQGCTQTNWEDIESQRGEKIVQFTCDIGDKMLNTNDEQKFRRIVEETNLILCGSKEEGGCGSMGPQFNLAGEIDESTPEGKRQEKEFSDAHESNRKARKALNRNSDMKALNEKGIQKVQIQLNFLISVDKKSFTMGENNICYFYSNQNGCTTHSDMVNMSDIYENFDIDILAPVR